MQLSRWASLHDLARGWVQGYAPKEVAEDPKRNAAYDTAAALAVFDRVYAERAKDPHTTAVFAALRKAKLGELETLLVDTMTTHPVRRAPSALRPPRHRDRSG